MPLAAHIPRFPDHGGPTQKRRSLLRLRGCRSQTGVPRTHRRSLAGQRVRRCSERSRVSFVAAGATLSRRTRCAIAEPVAPVAGSGHCTPPSSLQLGRRKITGSGSSGSHSPTVYVRYGPIMAIAKIAVLQAAVRVSPAGESFLTGRAALSHRQPQARHPSVGWDLVVRMRRALPAGDPSLRWGDEGRVRSATSCVLALPSSPSWSRRIGVLGVTFSDLPRRSDPARVPAQAGTQSDKRGPCRPGPPRRVTPAFGPRENRGGS